MLCRLVLSRLRQFVSMRGARFQPTDLPDWGREAVAGHYTPELSACGAQARAPLVRLSITRAACGRFAPVEPSVIVSVTPHRGGVTDEAVPVFVTRLITIRKPAATRCLALDFG